MEPLSIFALALGGFFVLAAMGIPLAFGFAIIGTVGVMVLMGTHAGLALLGTVPLQWASSPSIIVIPLFVLMGEFAFKSGITSDLYDAASKWIGRLPGGLALATMVACTCFAACTGSSMASAATISTLAYPEMKRFNYDDSLATGCISAGGTLGILIPPSLCFIIYGVITQQSIGVLFIAGILPGLLLSGLFLFTIAVLCLRNPKLGPRGEIVSWREKILSLSGVWSMLLLFILVIGGLYFGIFAPTEGGAIGAFGSLSIGLIRRRIKLRELISALSETIKVSCMIITLIIGAMIFMSFVTVSGLTVELNAWIRTLPLSSFSILILILLIFIPLGMFLDVISGTLLVVPIVAPIIVDLGFDLIWFGVLIVVLNEMGLITPPIGMNVFIVQGMTKVPLTRVFQGTFPFIIAMIIGLVLLVAFPEISLFLPSKMR